MRADLSRLMENKAELIARSARKRRLYTSVGFAFATFFSTLVLSLCLQMSIADIVWSVVGGSIALIFAPIFVTLAGALRLQHLIKTNRMAEARIFSHRLMRICLKTFPYSVFFTVAGMQMDIMRRDAAYHEIAAVSKMLRIAIEKFPYSNFTKDRLIPFFDNLQGIASLGLGEFEEAHRFFVDCSQRAKGMNRASFLNNVGVCDLQLERYEQAYKDFSEAIAAVPSRSRRQLTLSCFYPNLAKVCVKLGRLEEASALLEKSSLHFDKTQEDNLLRANFYGALGSLKAAEGHLDESEQYLRSAVEMHHQFDDLNPNVQQARVELANLLEKLGKQAEADALRKLVAENTLKLQLRLENSADALAEAMMAGTHPMLLMTK